MPMKVDRVEPITLNNRIKTDMFKKTRANKEIVAYSGSNVMKDSHFNSWNTFVLKMIDKAAPFMKKHPKFAVKMIKYSEKILNKSDIVKY